MKTGYGYKLFEMDTTGKLYPVFIGKNKETKIGEWIPAENLPTKGFAERPGWHLGMGIPDAPWLRGYDGSELGPYKGRNKGWKRVWCLCEYDATNDYRKEVMNLPGKCIKDRIPENGFYWFKEGSRGTWIITSAIRVVRVLDEKERREILKKNGYDEVAAYARYKVAFEKRIAS